MWSVKVSFDYFGSVGSVWVISGKGGGSAGAAGASAPAEFSQGKNITSGNNNNSVGDLVNDISTGVCRFSVE